MSVLAVMTDYLTFILTLVLLCVKVLKNFTDMRQVLMNL